MEHRARERDEQAEIKTTTCYMCACRCGIRVHLRDGEVRYIDGNPAHPLNQGVICAKGSSGIMKQYSPARLTQPLMRKPGAERGDAQFEPVSWEVAFDVLESVSRTCAPPTRSASRCSPAATRCRHSPACLQNSSVRRTMPRMAGSARRTWRPG